MMDTENSATDPTENNSKYIDISEDTIELPDDPSKDDSGDLNSEKENEETHKGVKRSSTSGESEPKRKRHKRLSVNITNPLMQLNELKPGLKYLFQSQEGPPHNPIFCFSVEVNGEKYIGKGNSKQKAKHDAARQALSSFVQFKDMPANSFTCGTNDQDFTSDDVQLNNGSVEKPPKLKKLKIPMFSDADKKNPCMLLNSLQPGLTYNLKQESTNNPNQRFQMSVSFEGEIYDGFGPNKKSAKAAAARAILVQRFKISFNMPQIVPNALINDSDMEVFTFPQNVADSIARAVIDTFSTIMSSCPEYAKWKVLAGIVLSKDEDMEDLQIISIGTGTKHLNGEYMSMAGGSLNDCHAEIISRRCLKEYFYSQLELHSKSKGAESIFEQKLHDKFALRPNYKFHLYISTSPCGDARVFSVHDEDITKFDPHPNRKARGLLRTKIESGEGTIPVKKDESIQTWDGIIQGQQRYLTMSCSDKVASWNVLGLQGSLLSHFIEPIYLHSIVLGRLFHPTHMRRALFNRFESSLQDLPEPYHLNKPKMCATTNLDSRQLTTSPNFSVNWTVGIDAPEVVTTRTGKTVQNHISRISKSALFKRFANFYSFLHQDSKVEEYSYTEAKNLSTAYRKSKTQMISAFVSAGLGTWVAKPAEQDIFTL